MPRARQICFRSGCPKVAVRSGACLEHVPKVVDHRQPWARKSKRNEHRSAGWTRLRRTILRRDNRTCYLCGDPKASEVDHIIPVAFGGTDEPMNLAACCRTCHQLKTAREAQRGRYGR
ncbi:HNH endonuclease [Streptomyces rimosus]|uniref:HNH endonuclease n=1 Tax=Streptomyces rimosus TaxID=1927 RepID=UPI000996F1F2|nr:HNH endonuclease [Streptomyces rimosus]